MIRLVLLKIGLMFCVFGSIALLYGCSYRLNKLHDYKPVTRNFNGDQIRASLIGTFSEKNNQTVRGKPYELLISYEGRALDNGAVIIDKIELINKQTDRTVFLQSEPIKEELEAGSDGKYRAYFSIGEFNFGYVEYILNIRVQSEIGSISKSQEFKLHFEKAYKEYRSNRFWDQIMSV